MHWPHAELFALISGPCFLIWLFTAGVGEFWNDGRSAAPSRISVTVYTMTFLLVIAGTIFRIQHWPYGNLLLIGGVVCCAIWFGVEFLSKRKGSEVDDGGASGRENSDSA
jgi:hypothetical protein